MKKFFLISFLLISQNTVSNANDYIPPNPNEGLSLRDIYVILEDISLWRLSTKSTLDGNGSSLFLQL